MSTPSCTSPRVSIRILPISRVAARASSSFRWAIKPPSLKSSSPRLGAGVSCQARIAPRAAWTAASTSSGPESGNSPSAAPVAGFRFVNVRPDLAGIQRPPIKLWNVVAMAAPSAGWQVPGRESHARAEGQCTHTPGWEKDIAA
jgi:hypothetical protein